MVVSGANDIDGHDDDSNDVDDLNNVDDDDDDDEIDPNDDNDKEGEDEEVNTTTEGHDIEQQLLQQHLSGDSTNEYPYQCCIEITLPNDNIMNHINHNTTTTTTTSHDNNNNHHYNNNNNNIAQQIQNILQVDSELTTQTKKTFTTFLRHIDFSSGTTTDTKTNTDDIITNSNIHTQNHSTTEKVVIILRIHVHAKQCKHLRVSISSILEYIQIIFKCYQEFFST
jgi:hypothetical protein